MANPRKIFLIISISTLVILFLFLYLSFFYLISYTTGTIISCSLLLITSYLLLRQIIHLLIYPGSSWLCLRSIESSFCVEMSFELLFKIRDLRHFAESVKSQEISQFSSDIVSVLNTVFNTLTNILNTHQWSKSQRTFYILLSNLKTHLSETLLVSGPHKKSLWDWLEESQRKTIPQNLKSEDQECPNITEVLKDCQVLEEFLFKAGGKVGYIQRIRRWISDDFIGNADYLREDLAMKFKCEQFWVGEKEKVNCLYVTVNPEGPTMLYCNPNAGYYEFALHRSEWFEFYYDLKVNLVLWNYPGYCRSQGSPSIKKILKYGEEIFNYLRDKKRVVKIGLHGESLGGFVATHLALTCKADFLFADRTFSSLSQVALNNFGKAAYYGFKLSCKQDIDSASNFLNTRCYKVISADSRDSMISDLASLKIGVGVKLLYQDFPESHILNKEETTCFLSSLIRVSSLVDQLNLINKEPLKHSFVYQPLKEDLELFDSENFKASIFTIKNLLNTVEAGGCPILESVKVKKALESLVSWLIVIDVWGTSLRLGKTESGKSTVNILRNVVVELEAFFDITQIREEIKSIHDSLKKVKDFIESRMEVFEDKPLSTSQDIQSKTDYESAGFLVSLNCGHAGPYSYYERNLYQRHLIKSKFIKLSR